MDIKEFSESLELIYDTKGIEALKNLGINIYKEDTTKREKFDVLCELADVFQALSNPEYDIVKEYTCRCLVGIRYANKLKSILDQISYNNERRNINRQWDTLKEYIKSEMNSSKVTLEDSFHYQKILNKMYELEELL